jgi:phenylacetate-CoA ligase
MSSVGKAGSKYSRVLPGKSLLEKIYPHVPVWAQNLGISLYGFSYRRERLGGVFEQEVESFRIRDRWSKESMDAFVEERLRTILAGAFDNIPYYSRRWRAAGLCQKDFRGITLQELPRVPLTPKRDLAADPESFITQTVANRHKLHRYYSSGSTGTPITLILASTDHQRLTAGREVRSFGWAGTSVRWPRSMLGGRTVVPQAESKGPYHRYNWAERQVYFSAYHISPDRVPNYVEAFNRYRPKVLTGYAHSHFTLGRMMLEQGIALSYQPKALVLSSEKLTSRMKVVIEQAFQARPYEEYGAVENCVLATECESGNLHVNPDFGIVEIVDEQGIPVPPGQSGRIICTGLLNETQPLIRYDIGDVGAFSIHSCACGRDQLPVLQEIFGRSEDVVIAPDGRQTVRFHALFINLPHVLEGQVIQEQLDFIRVRVVARSGFDDQERALIAHRLQERLGAIRVEVECVDEIERTERGKFRAVISRLAAGSRNGSPVTNSES